MVKAVIFDMDGVIIDSEPLFDNYLTNYLGGQGYSITGKDLKDLRGLNSQMVWSALKEKYGLPLVVSFYVEDVRFKYIEHLKSLPNLKPMEGIKDVIEMLINDGIQTALATSGSKIRMDTVLKLLDLNSYFKVKVSAMDVVNSKPDPELYLLAAELLGVEPEFCIAVEDSDNGILSAKGAGMKCIAYKKDGSNDQDLSNADMIIDKFDNGIYEFIMSL